MPQKEDLNFYLQSDAVDLAIHQHAMRIHHAHGADGEGLSKEARDMTDELMEQRVAELNARNTEKAPVFDSEKRAYSVDDIMSILDISRSSAYILIKKNFFRSFKIGKQLRISKASFDEWLDRG